MTPAILVPADGQRRLPSPGEQLGDRCGIDARLIAEHQHEHLAAGIEVEMPIVQQVYEMLYHAKSPQVVVEELMTRESKPEFQPAR